MFSPSNRNNSKSDSIYKQKICKFNKKSKSKSKLNLFNFKSPAKVNGK